MPEFNIIAEYIPSSNLTAQFIPVNFNVPPVLASKTITANGLYEASADNVTGYSSVTVAVPDRPTHNGELNITPTTEAQTIDVPSYLDGYGPVNVAAVTSAIDSNIQPENIKQGATILGVSGSVVESNETTLNVTPTTSAQTLSPTSPYTGFDEVNVSAVTSSIDPDIQPTNIREGVDILGVTGTAYIPEYFVDFVVTNGTLSKKVRMINLDGVTVIGDYALYSLYSNSSFPAHTHIDMSGITGIAYYGCNGCFAVAHNLESVDMSGVKGLSGSACNAMFKNCTSIQSVDLSSLAQITSWNARRHNTCSKTVRDCKR